MDQYESGDATTNLDENNLIFVTLSGSEIDDHSGGAISTLDNNSVATNSVRSFSTRSEVEAVGWTYDLPLQDTYVEQDDYNLVMGEVLGGVTYNFPENNDSGTTLVFDIPLTDYSDAGVPVYLNHFGPTDKVVFSVNSQYSDQTRYRTYFDSETGMLIVGYLNDDGNLITIATFGYINPEDPDMMPQALITDDGNGNITVTLTKCFLTGTNILTPDGEVSVENLRVGDMVMTLYEDKQIPKPIIWVGSRQVNINHSYNKENLYPIRIKAHAFDINQPCRDLLVTPEHTIYINNKLTPARMLVNDCSIIVDRSMTHFTVYHIETEDHSILLSENLTTESYLNTDDRHMFNSTKTVSLDSNFDKHIGHKNWKDHAAAPLAVSRDQIEPVWQELNNRAIQQGYSPAPKPQTTHDPSLCLITKDGSYLDPVDVSGNVYSFYVPQDIYVVALHSKAGLPSETIGPFVDDRRKLGVLVSKINVVGKDALTIIPADMSNISGWHPVEEGRRDRWTKGFAMLPTQIGTTHQAGCVLKIELSATAQYFIEDYYSTKKIA